MNRLVLGIGEVVRHHGLYGWHLGVRCPAVNIPILYYLLLLLLVPYSMRTIRLLLGCLCPRPFILNNRSRLLEVKYFWFCHCSLTGMFLSLDLLLENLIEYVTIGHDVKSVFSTRIFCGTVPNFAIDCLWSAWCHGLTTCLLYDNPRFEFIVDLQFWKPFLNVLASTYISSYIYIYILKSRNISLQSFLFTRSSRLN